LIITLSQGSHEGLKTSQTCIIVGVAGTTEADRKSASIWEENMEKELRAIDAIN